MVWALVPLLAGLSAWLGWRRKSIAPVALSILATGVCAVMLAGDVRAGFFALEETVSSDAIARYDRVIHLKTWNNFELLSAFPDPIPAGAEHVRFYYDPPFLQGGVVFQLRMRLPAGQAESLHQKFAPLAVHIFSGGSIYDHMKAPLSLVTTHFSQTDDEGQESLPSDYDVIVLKSKPGATLPSGEPNWNHCDTRGVAISRQRREIIYWAEQW